MTLQPFADAPAIGLLATTDTLNPSGFPLQNATPVILTWTAPSDGRRHRVFFYSSLHVATSQTGGQVNTFGGTPAPANAFNELIAGGQAAGDYMGNYNGMIVGPGQLVEVTQSTALTAGAATVWIEIWGS